MKNKDKKIITKKNMIILYIILIIPFIYQIIYNAINNSYIKEYQNENYNLKLEKKITIFNFYQPYVSLYNYGNGLYKTNDFSGASDYYLKALKYKMNLETRCKIKINYVLSELEQIDPKENDSIKKARLKELQNFLTEESCAGSGGGDGEGESEGNSTSDAQESLSEELSELIQNLKDTPDDTQQSQKPANPKPDAPENNFDQNKIDELDEKNDKNNSTKEQEDRQNPEGNPAGANIPYGPVDRIW